MNTELDKFVELYKALGIELKVNKGDMCTQYIVIGVGTDYYKEMSVSKKFCGYNGFNSVITFDESGRFLRQGFYE